MTRQAVTSLFLLLAGACGGRPEFWSEPVSGIEAIGLRHSVALTDPGTERVLMLSAGPRQELAVTPVHSCKNPLTSMRGPLLKNLFTTCGGETGVELDRPGAEGPSLLVIPDVGAGGSSQPLQFPLTAARTGIAVDPSERWVVLYASSAQQSQLVDNPNQIVIVDLTNQTVTPHSLRADAGGLPQRFSFASLGADRSPVLIVEREQDVALLDLANPARGELTARLTANVERVSPAGVVVSTPEQSADTLWVAMKQTTDARSIVTLRVQRAADGSLTATPNILDAGGTPADMAWVRTEDGGPMRLAVAVSSPPQAVLIEPLSSDSSVVALPYAYGRMTVVTSLVGGSSSPDTVLLWGGGVTVAPAALWSPGAAVAGTPYRSVEYLTGISGAIGDILDVSSAHPERKLLRSDKESSTGKFHILDLKSRQAAPLTLEETSVEYTFDPDGNRLWNYKGTELCVTSLEMRQLSPRCDLRPDRAVDAAYEIGSSADPSLHMVIALHLWQAPAVPRGDVGATVYSFQGEDVTSYDPANPKLLNPSNRIIYSSLLLMGGASDDNR